MTDEEKRVVKTLRRPAIQSVEIAWHDDLYRAITLRQVADLIEHLVRERDEARKIAMLLPDMCDQDCSGDLAAGIYPCPAYQPPDVLDDGSEVVECCACQLWNDCSDASEGACNG